MSLLSPELLAAIRELTDYRYCICAQDERCCSMCGECGHRYEELLDILRAEIKNYEVTELTELPLLYHRCDTFGACHCAEMKAE